jgi:hypothetical protein
MEYASVPVFDRQEAVHVAIARLGKDAHDAVADDDAASLAAAEAEIDKAVAGFWDISPAEMNVIRAML